LDTPWFHPVSYITTIIIVNIAIIDIIFIINITFGYIIIINTSGIITTTMKHGRVSQLEMCQVLTWSWASMPSKKIPKGCHFNGSSEPSPNDRLGLGFG